MLQWFRVRGSRIAAVTMAAIVAAGGSAVAPHQNDCHDAACRPVVVAHDAAAHRVGTASESADNHPLHCLVCHWVRAFRPRPEARIASTPGAPAAPSTPLQLFTPSAGAPVSQPPLRSPPTSPSLG